MPDEELPTPKETLAPDGGFGWVIVGALFALSFMSYGILYSIGTIFDVLVVELQCSDSILALSASTCYSFQCLLAPLVSPLQRFLSYRVMISCGVVLLTIALISSAFAPAAFVMFFTFGLVGGLGSAIVYLPFTVILSAYFVKKRGFAFAIAMVGSYAGVFVFPYVIRFLVSLYNWQGALIVLGAIQLNSIAAALFLLPVEATTPKPQPSLSDMENKLDKGSSGGSPNSTKALDAFMEDNIAGVGPAQDNPPSNKPPKRCLRDAMLELQITERAGETAGTSRRLLGESTSTPEGLHKDKSELSSRGNTFRQGRTFSEIQGEPPQRHHFLRHRAIKTPPSKHSCNSLTSSRIASLDNVYGSALALMAEQLRHGNLARSTEVLPAVPSPKEKPPTDEKQSSQSTPGSPLDRQRTGLLSQYCELLHNWTFVSFVFANFLRSFIAFVPSLFIVNYGISVGLSQHQTTILMSIIGAANVIGRPLLAYISDYHLASHRPLMSAVLLALLGGVTILAAVVQTFAYLAFFVFLFGFVVGFFLTQIFALMADMLPLLSQVVRALPIVLAAEGVGYFIGPPLLALLPSYEHIIASCGVISLLTAAIMAGIAIRTSDCRNSMRRRQNST